MDQHDTKPLIFLILQSTDLHAKMWFVKFSWMSNTITRFLASCSVVDLSKVELEVAFLHPVQNVKNFLRL